MKIGFVALLFSFIFISCYTIKQDIGTGAPKKYTVVHKHKWYALWGITPLNTVDAKKIAAKSNNYTVKTQFSVTDVIISLLTGCFSVVTQTITVAK